MKKFLIWTLVLICLMGFILLVFFIKNKEKYKFGYFTKGPEIINKHKNGIKTLNINNDVLILGERGLECPVIITPNGGIIREVDCKQKQIFENPFEIYNPKTNRITTLGNIEDYLYKPEGVLLDNNKILLIYAYNPNSTNYPKDDTVWEYGFCLKDASKKHWAVCKDYEKYFKPPYVYDSMIIVNLDTMKVEKEIRKKINETNMINPLSTKYTLLDNDKLLIIDAEDKIGEVYNFKTDKSEVIKNIDIDIDKMDALISLTDGEALLFGSMVPEDPKNSQEKFSKVYKFSYTTKSFTPVGKTINRYDPIIKQIDNNRVIILGGKSAGAKGDTSFSLPEIEIYDIKTNESKVVARLPETPCYLQYRGNSFNGAMIDNKHFLIAGGQTCNYPFVKYFKTPVVFDLDDYSLHQTMDLPYEMSELQMVSLDGGGALMINGLRKYNKQILLFKTWGRK